MSLLVDAFLWIGISTGFLLCVAAITAFWVARHREPLAMEKYHAEAERAYLAAKSSPVQSAPVQPVH